jgi:undecaprenyl-diphosphatase
MSVVLDATAPSGWAAPATPMDAAVGLTWIPYLVAGLALVALAALSRVRSRTRRDIGRAEFLLVRGMALLVVGVLVSLLADAAAEGDGLTAVDRPVWSWLVGHRTGTLTSVARLVTEAGSTVVMGALALVAAGWLLTRPGRRGAAILVAAGAAGAGLLVVASKPIVGRLRPPEEFRLVTETNQSFPSGHALASVAVLGVLAAVFLPGIHSPVLRRTAAVLLAVFVAAIGVSRLYLGVHWPTDVVGGWLAGAGWLLVCLSVHTLWHRYPVTVRWRSRTVVEHHPVAVTPPVPTGVVGLTQTPAPADTDHGSGNHHR